MIQSIGAAGVAVTAVLLWAVGLIFGTVALVHSVFPWSPISRDWVVVAFRFFLLLVWLLVGFLVMSQIKAQ